MKSEQQFKDYINNLTRDEFQGIFKAIMSKLAKDRADKRRKTIGAEAYRAEFKKMVRQRKYRPVKKKE